MARMKFLCDADRCIECNACVTACKNEHEVPWGINRRRVVTLDDHQAGVCRPGRDHMGEAHPPKLPVDACAAPDGFDPSRYVLI